MTDKLKEKEEFRYAPIGVFDSGVGGLTVAREIMRQIPKERIIYFGDTARVPYGSKSKETIIRFSRQIIRFLQSKGVKAIVIACNTASALALETVQPEFDIPILGVVKAGAKEAAKVTKNGKIGVIATESTIESQLYTKEIHSHKPNAGQTMSAVCATGGRRMAEGSGDGGSSKPLSGAVVGIRYRYPDHGLYPLSAVTFYSASDHGRTSNSGKSGL